MFEKLLGVFTERRSEAGLFRLNAGATLTGQGRGIYLVYRGGGTVDGQALRPLTTVFLERGERGAFTAEQETELLHFGLPDLRGLESSQRIGGSGGVAVRRNSSGPHAEEGALPLVRRMRPCAISAARFDAPRTRRTGSGRPKPAAPPSPRRP